MGHSETKLPALAFDIFRHLGGAESELRNQKLLIACSGGLDSTVLVDVLMLLMPRWNLKLGIAHVHHGFSQVNERERLRDLALTSVKALAHERRLEFFSLNYQGEHELRSENDLRKFRIETLNRIVENGLFDRVALAHHADDLLETRLMRLIRGTGPQGLRAMQTMASKTVRPFLNFPKSRLAEYAKLRRLTWIEDRSNGDETYFRNWLRNSWLPLLEKQKPGAGAAMARSLDLLTGAVDCPGTDSAPARSRFSRPEFQRLSLPEKQARLARLGHSLEVQDFGLSKVAEVLKRSNRLEKTKQKSTSFQVGGLVWKIDPHEISVAKS